MHKYHNKGNPHWTPPSLSSEQWENAYRDLKRAYDELLKENEAIKLSRDRLAEWRNDHIDSGC